MESLAGSSGKWEGGAAWKRREGGVDWKKRGGCIEKGGRDDGGWPINDGYDWVKVKVKVRLNSN